MVLLTESAAAMSNVATSATTESGAGLNDVLNEIIWMNSIADIVNTIIATGVVVVVLVVLLGVLQCFFGFRIFRYELALIGAVGGGAGIYVIGSFLMHWTGTKLAAATVLAAFLGGGMLFAVSAIIVFIMALAATTIALMVNSVANGWDLLPQVVIILSLAVALICMLLYKHVIIVGNAVIGAGIIGLMMSGLFSSSMFGLIIGVVFGVFGLITQYWMYIVKCRKEKEKDLQWEAQQLAKKTKIIDDEIPDVPKAESTSFIDQFPSQMDVERKIILRDEGFAHSELHHTQTISTGELSSKIKKL